jgi:hypothetical protein
VRRAFIVVASVLALAGCSKARDEAAGKRSPAPPPPPAVEIPADFELPVIDGGKPTAPLTAATLAARPADFADSERRAWRLDALLGDRLGPGEVVEAVGEGGVGVSLVPGDSRVAVLYLTRRGEMAAAVIDPADPFPDYHGQGGRLRRPGDPLPRVLPVSELRIRVEPAR